MTLPLRNPLPTSLPLPLLSAGSYFHVALVLNKKEGITLVFVGHICCLGENLDDEMFLVVVSVVLFKSNTNRSP